MPLLNSTNNLRATQRNMLCNHINTEPLNDLVACLPFTSSKLIHIQHNHFTSKTIFFVSNDPVFKESICQLFKRGARV